VESHWHEAVEPLAVDWDALADEVGASPFLRPGWVAAWWRAFGRGRLAILSLRRAGRLVGLVPLTRRGGALRGTANWHTMDFGLLAVDQEARQQLAAALFAATPRRATLGFLAAEGADLPICSAAALNAGYRLVARPIEQSCLVPTDGDWDAYQSRLPAGRRRDLRRCRRRLSQLGDLALEVCEGAASVDTLRQVLPLEASGWKGQAGTAILSRPQTRMFYTEVTRWAAGRGWLRLYVLRLDGRPLAFHWVLLGGDSAYHLKGGYDVAFRKLSPGILIIWEILARSFADPAVRWECLGAAEPYKLVWPGEVRPKLLLQAFAPSPAGLVDWAAISYGRPAAKRIQSLAASL
jgi:CelD/BcsL family acetyltransferase involved in cellulose biosynthesis